MLVERLQQVEERSRQTEERSRQTEERSRQTEAQLADAVKCIEKLNRTVNERKIKIIELEMKSNVEVQENADESMCTRQL